MGSLFADFHTDSVDVQTLTGVSNAGVESYTPHTGVMGMMDLAHSLTITATGQELVGAGTFWTGDDVPAAWFTPGSTLTWRGRKYVVLGVAEALGDPDLVGLAVTIR